LIGGLSNVTRQSEADERDTVKRLEEAVDVVTPEPYQADFLAASQRPVISLPFLLAAVPAV
jgi:hypothetical protein